MLIHTGFSKDNPQQFSGVFITKILTITTSEPSEFEFSEDNGILFVEKGRGKIGGSGQKFKAGSILVMEEGFKLIPKEDTTLTLVLVENSHKLLGSLRSLESAVYGSGLLVSPLVFQLSGSGKTREIYSHSALVYTFLMQLLAAAHSDVRPDQMTGEAVEMMEKNFASLEGIEEISEILGVSKHHFIRKFSEKMGISPGKYLENVRLERGTLLLRNTTYDLGMIASMVGYSSGNYFGKVFKRSYGITPKEYRVNNKNYQMTEEDSHLLNMLEGFYLV